MTNLPTFSPDPEYAAFLTRLSAAWAEHPALDTMKIAQARLVAEIVRAPWAKGGPVMAETREQQVPLPHGPMRVRIYRPSGLEAENSPALIYVHGGGFVFFSIDTHDRLMREYAQAAGIVVIGVDYPLSPEHRYPIALDQIIGFVSWLGDNAANLGVDASRLAIGGDSAGANLSLSVALRLRDVGDGERLSAILCNYGAFSGEVSDLAETVYGGPASILTREEMAFYFGSYLGSSNDAADPYAVPLLMTDLSGLPPMFFAIPEADVLREQSEQMAGRALACGVDVRATLYPGTTHSFLEAMSIAAVARRAIAEPSAWLRRILSPTPPMSTDRTIEA
jgi:acetyl esterase